MKKRGLSPLISTVLLIAFVVVLFVVISIWVQKSAVQPGMETGETQIASSFEAMNTRIEINEAELSGDTLKLTITNQGSTTIESLAVKLYGEKSSDLKKIELTPPLEELQLITEYIVFDINKIGNIRKIEITPILTSIAADIATKIKTNIKKDPYLLAYYSFNGNANDVSGNNNHGTVDGAGLTTDRNEIENSAYQFDGNDYIDLGTNLGISSSFTLTSWVKFDESTPISKVIIGRGNLEKVLYNYWLATTNTGALQAGFCYAEGQCPAVIGNFNTWNTNNWYHIATVYDSVTGIEKIYVNGVGDATDSFSNNPFNVQDTRTTIGAGDDETLDLTYFFNGKIDEVKIYNRALTEEEIKANAQI